MQERHIWKVTFISIFFCLPATIVIRHETTVVFLLSIYFASVLHEVQYCKQNLSLANSTCKGFVWTWYSLNTVK